MRRKHWLKNDKKQILDESLIVALASQENTLKNNLLELHRLFNCGEISRQEYKIATEAIDNMLVLIDKAKNKKVLDKDLKQGFLEAVVKLSLLKRHINEKEVISSTTDQSFFRGFDR